MAEQYRYISVILLFSLRKQAMWEKLRGSSRVSWLGGLVHRIFVQQQAPVTQALVGLLALLGSTQLHK